MPLTVLRNVVLLMILWGACESVATVFNAVDASMGMMASVNLIVIRPIRDHAAKKRAGQIDAEIWSRR
jgi:AGCS family alanine or glycine:cation symporter